MAELIIRQAEEKDILQIEEIEKKSFKTPWSYESIHHDIMENHLAFYVVGEIDGRVCGYMGIWNIVDEGHVTNVAVDPELRLKGIGAAILDVMLEVTEQAGIVRHTLEVRESNAAAIHLYESRGFKNVGIRKGYYEDDGEDAIIMWREKNEE